ncbi:FMN-binding negative transcriptional regulator [Parasphingorhabdus sp.]|uniref:FMN-binding negative transcriptional regulator n=1 Tax=Parasphingorhabdus sp. TaxID=2709688 RepID=UPI00300276F3
MAGRQSGAGLISSMPSSYRPGSPQQITQLIDQYPLAWLVSQDFGATPLPLLAEANGKGETVSLLGHIARRNPQYAYLQDHPDALVLFTGPQAYMSPNLLKDRDWAPTWNYAVLRMKVRVTFVPEETDQAVAALVAHQESSRKNPWSSDEMGERYEKLAKHIIAFRAVITSSDPTFKLGQDERPSVLQELCDNHPGADLVQWMRLQQPAAED